MCRIGCAVPESRAQASPIRASGSGANSTTRSATPSPATRASGRSTMPRPPGWRRSAKSCSACVAG